MDDMKKMGAGTAMRERRHFTRQNGRLTRAGVIALLIAVGAGWGLYMSWDWLAAAGLLTAVLILLACGAMCTTRWWSRWFGGGRPGPGSPGDSP